MPCDTRIPVGMTQEERELQIMKSLTRLENYLQTGVVNLVIGSNGAIAFQGWADNDAVTDVCAYQALMVQGSFALMQAVATAENMAGRQVNPAAIAGGMHSHDGGQSWGGH